MQYKSKFFKICLMFVMLSFLIVPDISQGRLNERAMNFNSSGGHAHDGVNGGTEVSFGNLSGSAIDSQIPDTITVNEATNADTVDGVHAAALEESSEIDADITTHKGEGGAHTASNLTNVAAGDIVATDVQAAVDELDTEKIPEADRGVANGIAELDANGNTEIEQLPPDVKTDIFYCGNESCQITAGADPAGLWTDVQGKWKLDDDGTWADVSGNGNDMGELGAPINEDGFLGGTDTALWCDGVDDALNISDASQVGLDIMTTGLTISAWIYMESDFPQNSPIVCAGSPYTGWSSSYCFFVTSTDKLALTLVYSSGNEVTYEGDTVLSFDTWYHVVATLGGNTIRIYLDNVQEGSGASFTYSIYHDDNPDFRIGRHWGGTRLWKGRIDDAAIWSRELTSGNRGALYALNEDFEVAPGASGDPAGEGDVCIRTDQNTAYMHNGGTDTAMTDWDEIAATTTYVDTDHAGIAGSHHTQTTSFATLVDSAIDSQIPDTITIDNATECDTVDGVHAVALEESSEIDSDISTHAGIVSSHHAQTTSFVTLVDSASDAQIPNTITVDNATECDTVDGVHAAALEESSEIDSDISTHAGIAGAHHTQTTSFATLVDSAIDSQIPDTITIDNATECDTVDGAHASALEESSEIDGDISTHSAIVSSHHDSLSNAYNITPTTVTTTGDIKINSNLTSSEILFGTAGDVNLYRSAANTLKTDDSLAVNWSLLVDTADSGYKLYFGSAADTNLYRPSANLLRTNDNFQVDNTLYFGSAADTNLYRPSANVLKTDDNLIVAGGVIVIGDDGNIYDNGTNVIKTDDTFQVAGSLVMTGDASTITHVIETKAVLVGPIDAIVSDTNPANIDDDPFRIRPSTADSAYDVAWASFKLPHGATITRLDSYGYTSPNAANEVLTELYRHSQSASSITTPMASCSYFFGNNDCNDTSISDATVDTTYYYHLKISVKGTTATENIRWYHSKLTYTTSDMSMTQ